MSAKDAALLRLLERLDLDGRGWQLVDHWDGDETAIGVAAKANPRRLVYVSVFSRAEGRYDYECEEPRGAEFDDYSTVDSGEDVTFEQLFRAMKRHLGGLPSRPMGRS